MLNGSDRYKRRGSIMIKLIQNLASKIQNIGLITFSFIFTFLVTCGPAFAEEASMLDSGDTAWMLVSTALVLFMTLPGLVRTKNVLSVLLQCFAISGIVTILWLAATVAYTAVATFVILKVVNAITWLRVCKECEIKGLDVYGHGEQGYIL